MAEWNANYVQPLVWQADQIDAIPRLTAVIQAEEITGYYTVHVEWKTFKLSVNDSQTLIVITFIEWLAMLEFFDNFLSHIICILFRKFQPLLMCDFSAIIFRQTGPNFGCDPQSYFSLNILDKRYAMIILENNLLWKKSNIVVSIDVWRVL